MLLAASKETIMWNTEKMPPIVEDLRSHSPEQLAEVRLLLHSGIVGRPDMRRPGFYEIEGIMHVYYVFRYPAGHKVLLIAAWQRETDPVAELIACNSQAA
jgi:hypothetical protein